MKLLFELKSKPAEHVPEADEVDLPKELLREKLPMPEAGEVDVIRHYLALSQKNYGVDSGFYPLGSCTMKYNPKINEDACRLPGFSGLHPLAPEETVQGALELMWELERYLCEITGMDAFSLQPAAGAHGELTACMIAKKHFNGKRSKVILPDSAHGTNPASAATCGFAVVTVKSDARGGVDIAELKRIVDGDTAMLMLTNPNTLGLFDENISEIARILHEAGALFYCDGANLNAMLGLTRPGDQGFDLIHVNLHKTFSTPHGGGGPGSGPIGVKAELEKYLPVPRIVRKGDRFAFDYRKPDSIGKVRSFWGNFGVMVRAYAYIRALGPRLKEAGEASILNANYLLQKLKNHYAPPFDRVCCHEFVLSGEKQAAKGIHTMDIAKRLLDYGFHAPTIYFPLIVKEALMIEPTETESRATLDAFADAMIKIAQEAESNPELLRQAPQTTPVGRLDGVLAARQPNLRWQGEVG
ncbi:MAG: aminomethyl-transferring glycine dehydrogenase subunit GcvPB [Candidatus Micrarchaeia archaeon]